MAVFPGCFSEYYEKQVFRPNCDSDLYNPKAEHPEDILFTFSGHML